jgi:hypothetical protein
MAGFLSSYLGVSGKLVVSGVSTKTEAMPDLLKVLKVDLIMAMSPETAFIKACLDGAGKIPVIVLSRTGLLYSLGISPGEGIGFVSLDSDLGALDRELALMMNDMSALPGPDAGYYNNLFTPGEKTILKLLARGKKDKEIALELLISLETLEEQKALILKKARMQNMLTLLNNLNKFDYLR